MPRRRSLFRGVSRGVSGADRPGAGLDPVRLGVANYDIITNSINGPLKIFVNNESSNNSISVELRDHRGNRFGIGGKVVIRYGLIDKLSARRANETRASAST